MTRGQFLSGYSKARNLGWKRESNIVKLEAMDIREGHSQSQAL